MTMFRLAWYPWLPWDDDRTDWPGVTMIANEIIPSTEYELSTGFVSFNADLSIITLAAYMSVDGENRDQYQEFHGDMTIFDFYWWRFTQPYIGPVYPTPSP